MTTLFISDLHLPPQPSALRESFLRFITGPARDAEALYILGDLFEYWIGDDTGLQDYAPEVAALAALTAAGVPVLFQHGNRDFLVGADFALLTGVRLLGDPAIIDLYGTPTLISHGDLFCTDDLAYQRWRRFSRYAPAQAIFRRLPLAWRLRVAGSARNRSAAHQRQQAGSIMDVNDAAVRAAFDRHGVRRIIHGHTHRPADHRLDLGDRACERQVLADWRDDLREALAVSATGMRRIPID